MNQNRLEIKVTKDANDDNVQLKAMSLEAAKALLVLLESITKIVDLTPNHKEIKIQISTGSAVVAAEGDKISIVKREFEKILENKSTNKELIEPWRKLQELFTANGLQYEANFFDQGNKIPIYDMLKSRRKLRAKPIPKKFITELEFLKGKLIAVGGKNPNIHVEVDGITLPPIACTEINATKAKTYLYQTIRFSVWAKEASSVKRYTLCDSYVNDEIFVELKAFSEELFEDEQIGSLKKLHYRCRYYLDNQDYGRLRKFMRLFIHESTDINILKTILIVTQSFKEHERLKPVIQEMKNVFDKKFKIVYKNSKK